jgi:hypothetical protein
MLLEILRALEGLATEFALVWLQRNMYADVRGDVVALDGGGAALAPGAGKVEVVCGLATDMAFANVLLSILLACATNISDASCLHREPLATGSVRRSPAIDTAGFRRRPRLMRIAEREVVAADLAAQGWSPAAQQAGRPEDSGRVVQT